MEQTLGVWVAPLLMIPGMALLVISTANRFSQLLLHLANHPNESRLRRQLNALRCALVSLYAGISAHALAGLIGGLVSYDVVASRRVIVVLSCVGVACLVVASIALTMDALRASPKR